MLRREAAAMIEDKSIDVAAEQEDNTDIPSRRDAEAATFERN